MIEPGQILQSRYRIDKQIGQGGMGAVYVATDERFNSTVAIKQTLLMDDNYRKAIEREARLLNSLKHPALPRVSDHFLEGNGQFLVMEYIPGEDLSHRMEDENKPFPVEEVLNWADQLLDALDFLHNQENPVIHRDIKPQNLKVTPMGRIILLDFGLAKGNPTESANKTAAKSIFGYSRNYASLEQIQGTGTDPRSDLYSLAATLYHLLTNTPPEDALTRAMDVLSGKPDPLIPANRLAKGIPAGVAGVLQNAMDLNSGLRPESALEMREMLKNYERHEHFATAAPICRPVEIPTLLTQKTRLMPAATHQQDERQTEIQTKILPLNDSELTVQRDKVPTEHRGIRRFAPVFGALLLASAAFAGVYVYETDIQETSIDEQSLRMLVEAPAIDEPEPKSEIELLPSQADAGETEAATTNNPDRVRTLKGNTLSARTSSATAQSKTRVNIGSEINPDAIWVGNMKINDERIETPNVVIDDNGIKYKTPKVHPAPAVPPSFPQWTPEQLRKFKLIRQNANMYVVTPKPTP